MIQSFDSLPGAICAAAVIHIDIVRPFDSLRKTDIDYVHFVFA